MSIRIIHFKQIGGIRSNKFKYKEVFTFDEALSIDKKCINRKTYNFIKALTFNNDFNLQLKQLRADLSIPENGYDFFEWFDLRAKKKEDPGYTQWYSDLETKSIELLTKEFNIPNLLTYSLPMIVLNNCVLIPIPLIHIDAPYKSRPSRSHLSVKIVVNGSVSINAIKNFVRDNQVEIYQELGRIKNNDMINFSEKGLKIVEYRNAKQKHKYKDIVDFIEKETGSIDERNNIDSVKQLYRVTRDKIKLLKRKSDV